ncbi:MAG TPA: hypothetical protein PLK38_07050, partial [Methanoregulaceae archaeon]|nr:hypothetical protein [Methanoregulaceae archaeon]
DKAASYCLDRVAERHGIIVVPEEPFTTMWRRSAVGDPAAEKFMFTMAHLRRKEVEQGKAPQAIPPLSML